MTVPNQAFVAGIPNVKMINSSQDTEIGESKMATFKQVNCHPLITVVLKTGIHIRPNGCYEMNYTNVLLTLGIYQMQCTKV